MEKSNKNTQMIMTAVLAVAVVVLFILHFTSRKSSAPAPVAIESEEGVVARMPIAYVNLDSLLNNYEYAVEMREKVLSKAESSQATLNQQGRALEAEMREFQRKIENNAFFDQARAQREQDRILKKQQSFQELQQKLQLELMQEEQQMNMKLAEDIQTHIKNYNDEIGKYQMILSNAAKDNVLISDPIYDITNEVIDYLNKQYKNHNNTSSAPVVADTTEQATAEKTK